MRNKPFDRPVDSYIEIDGEEILVRCGVDYSPAEPDVGIFDAGIEVYSVWHENKDIIGTLSDEQLDELTQRIWDDECDRHDHDARGDYLYDLRKD